MIMKKRTFTFICFYSFLASSFNLTASPGFFKTVASYFKPDEQRPYNKTINPSKTTNALIVRNHKGKCTIISSNENAVKIEAVTKGPSDQIANTEIITKQTNSTISVETTSKTTNPPFAVFYTITAPASMSITVEQCEGDILVKNFNSTLTLDTDRGSINVFNSTESITARAPKGAVSLDIEKLLPQASIFVETGGKITLTIPQNSHARLSAHTDRGFVSSQLPVTIDTLTVSSLDKKTWDALRRSVEGTIGFGTEEASLILSASGSIFLINRNTPE